MAHNIDIVRAFIDKLGDASKYDYTGVVNDLGAPKGRCVCGHPIRYEYLISDGTRTEAVGSECIDHFKAYNPRMYEKLKKAHENRLAKKREDEKKARRAQQEKEVAKLQKQYRAYKQEIREAFNGFAEMPRIDYEAWWQWNNLRTEPTHYKRASSYIKWYTERMDLMRELVPEMRRQAKKAHEQAAQNWEYIKATEKQIKYLKSLIAKARKAGKHVDEPDWQNMTKFQASDLISYWKTEVRMIELGM